MDSGWLRGQQENTDTHNRRVMLVVGEGEGRGTGVGGKAEQTLAIDIEVDREWWRERAVN